TRRPAEDHDPGAAPAQRAPGQRPGLIIRWWPGHSAIVTAPTAPAEPGQAVSHQRLLIIIGALLLGMLLAALDQTIVATALPTIAGDLHGLSHLSWVVTPYILASPASTPLGGKSGDPDGP